MAKGQEAKNYVANKLAQAFGADYIGEIDKKYYVWSYEGGEKVQVAIAMTCPKNPVGVATVQPTSAGNGMDFENMTVATVATGFQPAEITETEKKNIADLMAKLGL